MSSSTPTVKIAPASLAAMDVKSRSPSRKAQQGRGRSSSLLKVESVGSTSQEQVLDQNAYANINAEWVNHKGAWVMHPLLIFMGKAMIDSIPGMTQEISWTCVNLAYLSISYLMFHWATGIPFHNDLHGGAYDDLTLWEQIDDGAQYTPAKKWLICVPIALFLASTHYTHYNPWAFAINLTAVIYVLIPKLAMFHGQRIRFLPSDQPGSGVSTPITGEFPPSGNSSTPHIAVQKPVKFAD